MQYLFILARHLFLILDGYAIFVYFSSTSLPYFGWLYLAFGLKQELITNLMQYLFILARHVSGLYAHLQEQ